MRMAIAIKAMNDNVGWPNVHCSVVCCRKQCFRGVYGSDSDKADMCFCVGGSIIGSKCISYRQLQLHIAPLLELIDEVIPQDIVAMCTHGDSVSNHVGDLANYSGAVGLACHTLQYNWLTVVFAGNPCLCLWWRTVCWWVAALPRTLCSAVTHSVQSRAALCPGGK